MFSFNSYNRPKMLSCNQALFIFSSTYLENPVYVSLGRTIYRVSIYLKFLNPRYKTRDLAVNL